MKVFTFLFLALAVFFSDLSASPKINFKDLVINAEQNSSLRSEVYSRAKESSQPVSVLTAEGAVIEAKGIEDGKLVYAVITDKADIYNNAYTAFYDEISATYDLTRSKMYFADGKIADNSNGRFNFTVSDHSGMEEYLMVTYWTDDNVYLLSKVNGDVIDPNFIPPSPSVLGSPKMAMQDVSGLNILIADQINDGVFKFDTSGAYIGLFAPNGGINNSILDNVRGIRYRSNNNLLVCNASGASANTIQQFDTDGNFISTFIGNTNLNSPFDILIRSNDMLITNSSGTNKITRFDLDGNFLSNFYSGSNFNFPQQMQRLPNGNILVAAFSTPSGIAVLDSNGNFIRLMTGVSGLRSVFVLGNGNYLVTNGAGIHEVDTINANIIRTIVSGTSFQYITVYKPVTPVGINNSNSAGLNDFRLEQNYPNPFNPTTNLEFGISELGFVSLKVFDATGKEVAVLVNENKSAGSYSVSFNGSNLSSGIYFYKLESGGYVETKRMVLLK